MMRNLLLIVTIAVCSIVPASARTIKDFFIDESADNLFILEKNTRMDLWDYYTSGMKKEMSNTLGGISKLNYVTENGVSVQLSKSNKIDMHLYVRSKKDTLIVVVNTVKVPATDSQIQLYDENWNKLETKYIFKAPTIADFVRIPIGDKTKVKDIAESIEIPFISYTINEPDGSITAHQNMKEFLSKEEYEKLSKYLVDSIKYVPTSGKFKLAK